jgi:uncharacterized repeat protein (TIGR01451 family)/fimbrial isopeptide formation D2 family protein
VNAPTEAAQPQLCAVPEGQQVWIWSDVNDLPQGATVSATVTVRPDLDLYPVGSTVGFAARAFTSNDPTRLPTYDGSPSVARSVDHTSGAGSDDDDVPVRALRVTKSVTDGTVESELLRGVHDEIAGYTVKVRNTTRGATDGVVVTDYLPAGLEYLGLGAGDNSTGAPEYPGAPAVSGGAVRAETVETVRLDAAQAAALKLSGAGVYTKVSWTLGTLAAGATAELTYRAAVPLFENELWAEDAVPAITGAQAANLANNTGASTRHGGVSTPQDGQSLRNVASAAGSYTGPVLNGDIALRAASDSDSETVEAVDVRVAKSVDTGAFASGRVAIYTVTVDASEYTDATAVTLTDVIPNGLCPAFPIDASGVDLLIDGAIETAGAWNDRIPGEACTFPSTAGGAVLSEGLTVQSIDYATGPGTFSVVFTAPDVPAGGSFTARYSAMQRTSYTGGAGVSAGGGTSSGDSFVNRVEVTAETRPIAAIAGDPTLAERVGKTRHVSDGSSATIASGTPTFTKDVLQRGQTPGQKDAVWAKDGAQPFSPGDDVWYRVQTAFATGIDTRNAVVSDYLPEGVRLVETLYAYRDMPGFADRTTPSAYDGASFPTEYLPQAGAAGNELTWEFGARNRIGSDARFMPAGSTVTMYIHAKVTGQSATRDDVDSPRNHAKYQQVNVHGDIWFDRDDAGIDLDWGSTLTKGIYSVNGTGLEERFGDRAKERQVVQGDEVAYRLDITAPQNVTTDYVVWDVLPAGVLAADVRNIDARIHDGEKDLARLGPDDVDTQTYEPGAQLPDDIRLTDDLRGRAVVVWNVHGSVPGSTPASDGVAATSRGLSLGYTLVVPDGTAGGPAAQLTQRYVNTAGLISYGIENSPTETTTVVPQQDGGGQQLTNRTPRAGEVTASDIDTVGKATVVLPDLSVAKKLVSTEVIPATDVAVRAVDLGDGPRNSAAQVVQGEYSTFEYSVTIPARTSIQNAVLSDAGMLRTAAAPVAAQYVDGSARFFGPDGEIVCGSTSSDFRCTGTRQSGAELGVLTFPDTYTNSTTQAQTFRAQVTVWVKDHDAASANSAAPQIAHRTDLYNTASVVFADPNTAQADDRLTRSAEARVQFVEPDPTLTKQASSPVVGANGEVTYTLTASNASGRPALYDAVVIDCVPVQIVPGALVASVGSARTVGSCEIGAGNAIQRGSGTGTLIEWTIPEIRGTGVTGAPTLTYVGTVQQQAGGGSQFTNRAELTGYTLPLVGPETDTSARRGVYAKSASATVSMPDAGLVKTVTPASAPVGSVVTYTLKAALPAYTNFYDVELSDVLPAGVEFLPGGTHTETTDWKGAPDEPTIGAPVLANGKLSWAISTEDIRAAEDDRSITVTFQARLTPSVVDAKPTNRASFVWKKVDGSTVQSDRVEKPSSAVVTIVNPSVTIGKQVKPRSAADTVYAAGQTGNPGESFTYRVRATNSTSYEAYNVVITDRVFPGVRVDTTQSAFAGAEFSDEKAIGDGLGGTVTWRIAGPFTGIRNFVYDGTFVDSGALTEQDYRNTATVTRYESWPSGGWVYQPGVGTLPGVATKMGAATASATIRPLFPSITLTNRVTNGVEAFVGEPFSWTLEAVNVGKGPAQMVTLTDMLPINWEYDPAVTPRLTVAGQPAADLPAPVIAVVDGRQTLTWTIGSATGQALLAGWPGGTATKPSLSVTFSTKPLADAVENSGAGLKTDHRSMLSASATDTTGVVRNATGLYVGADAPAAARIARADLRVVKEAIGGTAQRTWIAGDAPRTGYTQPQWQITITNQGPDAAMGPFVVTDEAQLPTGVTTGTFSARYFAAGATTGTPVTISGSGTASDPFVVGDRAASLAPTGADRIVLLADVTVSSATTGTATNSATSTGRTYEATADLPNNTSAVSRAISTSADLAIEKTVGTGEVTAGRPITWAIRVLNNGPSVAASPAGDRIIVTDTIPAGISGVADPSDQLTSWTVTASDGWPASAGDTITWTFTGDLLPVGPAQLLSLRGTVDSSWTGGGIRNTAAVEPGSTSDPVSANNTSGVTVTPGDATTLAVTKTRVVLDDGVWKDASQLGSALPPAVAGDTISYRVVVANNGPADARGVTVVDEVPSTLAFVSVQNASGTWTRTAGPGVNDTFTVAGTIPASAEASTRSFVVTYRVAAGLEPGTAVANWVRASATNAPTPVRDGDTTDAERIADLAILKQALDADGAPVAAAETAEVTAGTQTRFRLTVTNGGPSVSGAPITVSDRLPLGLTYVSSTVSVAGATAASATAVVSEDGRTLTWTPVTGVNTLAAGATVVIDVTTSVAADVRPQRLVNAADVTGPSDVDPANNHSEVAVDVVTRAELSIRKDAAAGPWIAGTPVSYTLTVRNDGPSVADAFVSDVLPTGLTAESISGDGWDCTAVANTCVHSALPLGESTLTVTALIASSILTGTELTNTATLSWTDSRTASPHEDTDDATITVTTSADLRLVKTAIDASGDETAAAVAGESVRYRLAVDNAGPSDAVGPLTVVDALPAGVRFVGLADDSAEAWSAVEDAADPQTVTFTLLPPTAGVASGAAAPTLEFEASVDAAVGHGVTLTNTATAASGTPDPTPANSADTAAVTVARQVDLAITKTHDPEAVRIGDELPFVLGVRNQGPSEATDVVVTDTVPAELEVLTAPGDVVGDDWTVVSVAPVDPADASQGTLITARYALGLAPGATSGSLDVRTRVLVAAYPEVVNVAEVSSAEITVADPDRTPADNRVEDTVTVPPMAALVVTKTATGTFQVGKAGEYGIVVRNDGPTADPGPITVTDVLPDGLTFAGSPDAGVRSSGRTVTWTLADGLAAGEVISLTLRVNVGQAAYPSVTNVAVVQSDAEQTDDARLADDVTVPVEAADALAVTGGEMAMGLLALALLLVLAGGVFVTGRRRDGSSAEAAPPAE